MCIIVFDLVMVQSRRFHFLSFLFLVFQRENGSDLQTFFSFLLVGELPADLSVNMVCMYVVACDVYMCRYVRLCTTCTHTHTHMF